MPLDLHIVETAAGPFKNRPVLQFDQDTHGEVFYGGKISIEHFPLLGRLKDYYEDAIYVPGEFCTLKKEVLSILPAFGDLPLVQARLKEFFTGVEEAERSGKTIVFVAD